MSLPKNQQEELFSANNELPEFLADDHPMVVFGRDIYPAFKDDAFTDFYSTKGRWATSHYDHYHDHHLVFDMTLISFAAGIDLHCMTASIICTGIPSTP